MHLMADTLWDTLSIPKMTSWIYEQIRAIKSVQIYTYWLVFWKEIVEIYQRSVMDLKPSTFGEMYRNELFDGYIHK